MGVHRLDKILFGDLHKIQPVVQASQGIRHRKLMQFSLHADSFLEFLLGRLNGPRQGAQKNVDHEKGQQKEKANSQSHLFWGSQVWRQEFVFSRYASHQTARILAVV